AWRTRSPGCPACGRSRTTWRSISSSRRNVWSNAPRLGAATTGVERLDERRQVARGERLAEVIALHPVAPELAQGVERPFILHALGERAKVEGVRQVHQGAHDLGIPTVRREIAHETLVDLELVERELAQVGERGIPGTEVVDGELAAQRLQSRHEADRARFVLHDGALGQLQREPLARHA